jgi:GDP-L-fucose synthase
MENIDFNDLVRINKVDDEVRNTHINVGSGSDLEIKALADLIKTITGFRGNVQWDSQKPDGTSRKLMDVSKLNNLGWKARVRLEDGIRNVYYQYIQEYN